MKNLTSDCNTSTGIETNFISSSNTSSSPLHALAFPPWANPDDIISAETEKVIFYVVNCGISEIVDVVGMVCNLINLVVFAAQGLTDRVTLMLFVLAIVDFIFLVSHFILNARCFMDVSDAYSHIWPVLMLPEVLNLNLISGNVSMLLLTLITVERCLAVRFPLEISRYLRLKTSVCAMATVTLLMLVCFGPMFFVYNVIWRTDPDTKEPSVYLEMTEFGRQITQDDYIPIRNLLLMALRIACFIVVGVCCFVTVRTLKTAARARECMTNLQGNDNQNGDKNTSFTSRICFTCCKGSPKKIVKEERISPTSEPDDVDGLDYKNTSGFERHDPGSNDFESSHFSTGDRIVNDTDSGNSGSSDFKNKRAEKRGADSRGSVKNQNASMQQGQSSKKKCKISTAEVNLTRMLVVVAVAMEVYIIPDIIFKVVMQAVYEFYTYRKYHNLFLACQYFPGLAVAVNSASNFFFYFFLISNYRATLKRLCCRTAEK